MKEKDPKTQNLTPSEFGPPEELTPDERQLQADYEWAAQDTEVRKKYYGQVVAVYHGVVLGVGKNDREALAAARNHKDFPHEAKDWVTTVPIIGGPTTS